MNYPNYDQQQAPQGTTVVGSQDGSKLSVTLKAGTGYDAPWVVFYGATPAEIADQIGAATAMGLFATVANAAKELAAQVNVAKGLGAVPANGPAQTQQQYQQTQGAPPQQQYQQQPPAQQQGGQQWQGGQQQAQQMPAGAPPNGTRLNVPQGVVTPQCPHGTKQLISGKFGPFWGCPAQQGDPSKCKTEKYQGPPPF